MKREIYKAAFLAALLSFGICSTLLAAETSRKDKVVTKSQNNINFNLPEDWPIQEKDGAVGPVPIEEYIALKFDSVTERLQKIETVTSELSGRIKTVEEQLKRPRKLRETETEEETSEEIRSKLL